MAMSTRAPMQSFWICNAVVLDLDEEVLLAEDLLIPQARCSASARLAVQDVVGELEPTQPDRQISPSACRSRISLSIRGL